MELGFVQVPSWECLYVHPKKQLFLSIYVDDFCMVGKNETRQKMWNLLSKRIVLDPQVPMNGGTYLGCTQYDIEAPENIIKQTQEAYPELTSQTNLPKATCAKNDEYIDFFNKAYPSSKRKKEDSEKTNVRAWEYEMTGHAVKCVEKYLEITKMDIKALKKVVTPNLDDHQLAPEDFEAKGELHEGAATVVLTCLFLARFQRPDICWTVNSLAREVTRWNLACDRRLLRLISYLHHTKHYTQSAFVGDVLTDLRLLLFTDASFAGD